jgi:hypothetical protein
LEKIYLWDDNHKKYQQEMRQRHLFLKDVEKIKTLEKEIQEKFDSSFVLNSETL